MAGRVIENTHYCFTKNPDDGVLYGYTWDPANFGHAPYEDYVKWKDLVFYEGRGGIESLFLRPEFDRLFASMARYSFLDYLGKANVSQ